MYNNKNLLGFIYCGLNWISCCHNCSTIVTHAITKSNCMISVISIIKCKWRGVQSCITISLWYLCFLSFHRFYPCPHPCIPHPTSTPLPTHIKAPPPPHTHIHQHLFMILTIRVRLEKFLK